MRHAPKGIANFFVYMGQQALVISVITCLLVSIAQLVLGMHMGFQSIFKVWEVL